MWYIILIILAIIYLFFAIFKFFSKKLDEINSKLDEMMTHKKETEVQDELGNGEDEF